MTTENSQFDKRKIRKNFDQAARTYDQYASLQKEVASRLDERFDFIRISPEIIMDFGSGTGQLSHVLAKRFSSSKIIGMDLSFEMTKTFLRHQSWYRKLRGKVTAVCGDIEAPPFSTDSCDLLVSSLTLQWCNNPDRAFEEAKRIIKPGGLFMFTTFGPDSLRELRSCWEAIDSSKHVSAFYDMHDLGDAMLRHGFIDPVMDVERITSFYPTVKSLTTELKMIGASNALGERSKGLTGKSKWKALNAAYEQLRQPEGLPASYEIVYGHAWVPDLQQTGGSCV